MSELDHNPAGTLILICGLPGSGKTTLAKRIEAERRAIRLCADEWIEAILDDPEDNEERDRLRDPVENLQWDLARTYLQKGLTVILENGFWAEEERSLYAMGAIELGARIEICHMEASSFEELWLRVSDRNSQLETQTFRMTEEELRSAFGQFEPPSEEEMRFYDEWTESWH